MSKPTPETHWPPIPFCEPSGLRTDAEARIKGGTAPPTQGWPLSVDTLRLLQEMISKHEGAEDALKVLHELQVHQVELDLQHEQMEAVCHELAEDLAHFKERYDCAPAAYFVVGAEGRIIEGNRAGAYLFGVAVDELGGRPIDSLLTPESRSELSLLLERLRNGSATETCQGRRNGGGASARRLQIVACPSPTGRSMLMVVVETTG